MFFSLFHYSSSAESEDLAVHLYPGAVTIQGVLRRKTLLKEGKKPTVRSYCILFLHSSKKYMQTYRTLKNMKTIEIKPDT